MELRLTIIIWLYSLAVLHSPSTPLCGLIVTLYFYRRKSPTKKIMKRGLVCLMQHSVKTLTCSARAGTQHHAGLVIDPTSQDVSHPSLCLPHHFIFVRQPLVSLPPSSFRLRTSATRLSASLIISSSYVSHTSPFSISSFVITSPGHVLVEEMEIWIFSTILLF